MKPRYFIDIDKSAGLALECIPVLALASREGCQHLANGLRQPLGIYNVSIARVCDKLTRLCQRLELYFQARDTIEPDPKNDDLMQEVLDYLELSLYAAAEHVDDLQSIASGFFTSDAFRDRNGKYKAFAKFLKERKRFIALAANAIKHRQSRLRLFSIEYSHAGRRGTLHGYFVEGVANGVVGSYEVLHKQQEVFSITAFPWEVITFLLDCSRELHELVQTVGRALHGPYQLEHDPLAGAAVAAARLPLYTFGEVHPFQRCTVVLRAGEHVASLNSGLYGSIATKWSKSDQAEFGRSASRFAGDGQTRSFRLVHPKSIEFQHWE